VQIVSLSPLGCKVRVWTGISDMDRFSRPVVARGYEGIVAKDPESRYVPGRTLKWLKIKQKDYRKEERGFYRE